MNFSRPLASLLFLLTSLAPLSAQTQRTQEVIDYRKLQYKIPLVNEKSSDAVVDVAFSLDSKVIAVLYSNSIGFWTTSKGEPLGFAPGTREKFTALAFGSNGLLATGTEKGAVSLWDWHDLTRPKLTTGSVDPLTAIAISPDNSLLVSAHRSDPPSVVVWDATTGKTLKTLTGFSYAPTALKFTPDGSQLLTGGGGLQGRTGEFFGDIPIYSTGGEFARWNLKTGSLQKQVGFNNGGPNCAFSSDGTLLAFVGSGAAVGTRKTEWFGNAVRVWRVPSESDNDLGSFLPTSFKRREELTIYNSGRPAIAFSADNRVVGFCEDYYQVTLWSGGPGLDSTHQLVFRNPGLDWYFPSGTVSFSPDGEMMAAAGSMRAGIWKIEK